MFARAQAALAEHDHAALLGSIRPETRRRWLTDLAFGVALASGDEPGDADETRRTKRQARELLARRGATARVTDPREISVEGIQRLLLDKVADPDELFVALLDFAEAHGAPLDPVRALDPGRGPSAAAAPLVRLATRVRAPHRLEAEPGPPARGAGSADPRAIQDALWPLRFHTEGASVWLDES